MYMAWDIDAKKMWHRIETLYDGYIYGSNIGEEPHQEWNYGSSARCFGEILKDKNFIVLEYTGLKDRNGKEIYEGDIVRYSYCGDSDPDSFKDLVVSFGPHNVESFHNCVGFWLGNLDSWPEDFEMEIVGSIYESPELLK